MQTLIIFNQYSESATKLEKIIHVKYMWMDFSNFAALSENLVFSRKKSSYKKLHFSFPKSSHVLF